MVKAADQNLKIPAQLYVGVQGKMPFNKEDAPLAFAVPYGDKRFTDSRSTVDGWAGYNSPTTKYLYNEDGTPQKNQYGGHASEYVYPEIKEEGFIIDNEFLDGFYFEKSVSRWRTSNKFFRINDPRGFQLEIDSENLGDILLNSHISKGMLVGKFKWTRYNGKAFLVRENHPSLSTEDKPKVARTIPKVGDLVCFGQDATYKSVYIGKFYPLLIGTKTVYKHKESGVIVDQIPYPQNSMYGYNYAQREANNRALEEQYDHVIREVYFRDTKGFHLYESLNDSMIKISRKYHYQYYRGYGTVTVFEEDQKFNLPKLSEEVIHYNPNGYGHDVSKAVLFSSKKDLLAFDVSTLDINSQFITDRKESYDRYAGYGNDPHYTRYRKLYEEHPVVERAELESA